MAKKQKSKKKKWIIRLLFLCLFVGAVAVTYFVWDAYFHDKSEAGVVDQQEQSTYASGPEEHHETNVSEQRSEEDVYPQKVEQYDVVDNETANGISGVITYAGVVGDNLVVRVNIDQYLDGGECRLTLWSGNNLVHEEAARVVDNASTSTCEGFDVPLNALGSGHLDISINIESNSKTGVVKGGAEI